MPENIDPDTAWDPEALADQSFECGDEHEPPSGVLGALGTATAARGELTAALRRMSAETPTCTPQIEITGFIKKGGPLTKQISLSADNKLVSDGSACVMSAGYGWRQNVYSLTEFADIINNLRSNKAIALGPLRDDLSPVVEVIPKRRLQKHRSNRKYDVISRTSEFLEYRPGCPALVLLDVDTKGMPPEVRDRVEECGGFWHALTSVVPQLANAARIIRASTSAGICRADTGQAVPGSDGQHIYLIIKDGADAPRFLNDLHARCRVAGFGWDRAGAAGQRLERSLVDRMVGRPERLVFEAPPILDAKLVQDAEVRRAVAVEGEV